MKLEQLPSGSYRVRKMVDGHNINVVFDHKPKEFEIMQAIADKARTLKSKPTHSITMEEAIRLYVEANDDMSVATKREYLRLHNRLSSGFLAKKVKDITQESIDAEITYQKRRKKPNGDLLKPKTVINYITQACAVIRKYNPALQFDIAGLPKEKPELEDPYIPTRNEVKRILDYANSYSPQFYIAIALAASCGLRREEIIALQPSDIDQDYQLHIVSAIVCDENNKWVEQGTKTVLSTRLVPIPRELADRIRIQGYVYHGHPHSINKCLKRILKKLDITDFSLHKLRHYFATELADAGVPEADILYLCGWSKSSDVMRRIYRHSRAKQDRNRRAEIVQALAASFYADVMTNCHNPAQTV